MDRREFLHALAAAGAAGLPLGSRAALAADGDAFYDVPRFGNVSLLHMTDCHAQLLPVYFREPNVNLGIGAAAGKPPHLVGEQLLRYYGMARGSRDAYAFTHLDFPRLAQTYGRMGGFAHLATLVKRLKASRPGALLLDGGDTWQGSATALWTKGQDMIDAQKLLGVDIMTGHWEFTYGQERVKQVVENDFKGRIEFLAQNVTTADFGDPVFKPYVIREDQRRARSRSSDRRFPIRRSPTRATSFPTGPSASRRASCRSRSTRCGPRAPRSWCCCRTTAWTWT